MSKAAAHGCVANATGRSKLQDADEQNRSSGARTYIYAVPAAKDNSDLGIDQVAVVLQDSKHMTRVHFGISSAEAQRMKEKSCEKYAVICPEGRLIDLAEPTNITVDYSLPGVGP